MNRGDDQLSSLFIILSAPSGAGKTTMCRRLLASCPNLSFSVSFTTRMPRPGEEGGKDYYFISEESFKEKIAQGEFVEWVENYGQFYGTSRKVIDSCLKKGCDIIIDVEPRGAGKIKAIYPRGILVFVLPPSWEELKNRLIKRGYDKEEELRGRLAKADDEIKEVVWYDYIIFNDCLDEAVNQLHAIYIAEKTRRERLMGRVSDFLRYRLEKA